MYNYKGLLEQCIQLVDSYVMKMDIMGLKRHLVKLDNKEAFPMVIYTIEASGDNKENVMIYGHLDKQPYGEGWDSDKTPPNKAHIINGVMYGRGGSDDGYAIFSSILAIKAIQHQNLPHPRFVIVLETEEESGSVYLIQLLKHASQIIQEISYCICLDSGCMDYGNKYIKTDL